MNVYQTIAERNTEEAANFCIENGCPVNDENEIAITLQGLVENATDQEAAYTAVMNMHPDKEIIVELYTTRNDFECGPLTDCGQRLASIKRTNLGMGNDGSVSGMNTPNLHPKILTSTNIILSICAIAIIIAIASKS